ncbi:hypothetical protein F4821DRAFT_36147 [Hypoxylon rubiginosum]|uniref:Uncharacterized protein n=1 Tax=Hypoxylon rubiginosum TaxID=110542 RepID=A0ACC0DBL5_9PEZI|nr:hypothetical protein F4821DRAFT_36147 [Hypoxylon rubiginosum]
MGDGLPAPATSAGPNQWPMENIAINNNNSAKKSKTSRWFSSSGNTTSKDGWFKNPRDTSWTIDTVVNGKAKPAGYDSNTLITVVRSSQCFCAGMTLIFYVATMSAPAKWLFILAIAVCAISLCWSMCVLWMRHIWSTWLVIPELLITFAWIVLYGINTEAKPDESKAETFRVAMIAIEASMVLWIQTCLLMVTPFFHQLCPWIIRKIRTRKAPKPPRDAPVDIELVS